MKHPAIQRKGANEHEKDFCGAVDLSHGSQPDGLQQPAGMPADASVTNFSSSSSWGEASSTLSDEDKALLESVEIPSSVSSETTVTTSDGSTVTVRPDGSKTIEKADGSTVTVTSEGTVTTTPAGNGGGTLHEAFQPKRRRRQYAKQQGAIQQHGGRKLVEAVVHAFFNSIQQAHTAAQLKAKRNAQAGSKAVFNPGTPSAASPVFCSRA